MRQIDFLGNPCSPHVRHWEMVMSGTNLVPLVHGLPQHVVGQPMVRLCKIVGPAWIRHLPIILAYALAGFRLRWLRWAGRGIGFVHAHNVSGYGLVAWLSGEMYGLTTYGSEIYDAPNRGWAYRSMIRKVLRNATFITSASPQMTQALVDLFSVSREKIHEFYMGVADVFVLSGERRQRIREQLRVAIDEPVWVVNRRVHSLYSTVELVQAFKRYAEHNASGILVVLQGDADGDYLKTVVATIAAEPRIHLIHGFLTQEELCDWLCAADFAISIPRSDQLSSSILEAMSCGAVPVLGNLPAYAVVKDLAVTVDIHFTDLTTVLECMFISTSKMSSQLLMDMRMQVQLHARSMFSLAAAARAMSKLYASR
jgi:glycosyltransferase involved in cell wall biosynthesis